MDKLVILLLTGGSTLALYVLVRDTDGPFDIFLKFRSWIGIWYENDQELIEDKFFANLLSCSWCSSTWISLPILIMMFIVFGRDIPLIAFPFFWLTSIAIAGILYKMV